MDVDVIFRSDDESNEFGAVSNSLSSEDVEEDWDDDVVGPVSWVLDNGVSNEENDSDVFEAVAG